MSRSTKLEIFLRATRKALIASNMNRTAEGLTERLFLAAQTATDTTSPEPFQLPVCDYLDAALERARSHGGESGALAEALGAIAPMLAWSRRPKSENDDAKFQTHHANAVVFGENGLESRSDILIGMSLLAPNTRYPDHHHPPEEIYTVLSPGEWKQNDGPWHEPGVGGHVHNPSDIVHGMRANASPLLAVWCLWTGEVK